MADVTARFHDQIWDGGRSIRSIVTWALARLGYDTSEEERSPQRAVRLQVTTVPSSTAHVGSGALLQCRFDVGGPVALDSLRVTWYFWEEKLAWYDQGSRKALHKASLPSEKELQSGDASLSLAAVTVPDGGLYRCVVGYGTQQHKGETILRLLAAPTISIPRKPALANAETSLLCHVGRFFPEDVDVAWMRDGQVLNASIRSSPQRNADGTFNLTLTYTFTPARSDAGSVFFSPASCVSCAWPPGWAVSYNVSEVEGPERCLLGQEGTLRCSMEGTFPKDTVMKWGLIHSEDRMAFESNMDQESPEHQPLLPALAPGWRVTEERAGTRLTSSLTFTPTLQDDGARVRCVFLHEAKQIREERVSPEIRVWARPQVSEIQVLPEWDPRDKVPFAVQLHNFYPREVPVIQWGWDGAGSWREDPAQIDKNTDSTFTATSVWRVPSRSLMQWGWGGAGSWREDPAQIDKNTDSTFTATSVWRVPSRSLTRPELRVQVCVQHSPGEPPSERELSLRDAGLLRPPDVSEISQPESVATGKGVTLSCRIAGHFPGELSVTWLRRGKGEDTAVILRDSAECRVEPGTAVLARDGKSFQQETRLVLLAPKKEKKYICRVGHLALETPIERSTAADPTS
ncbi:uncharacterized protein LOC102376111 [Alligator sinensis]|uniref:Uncharacterized protein LOC102376111 n=1 Tax=Alligator sinensis TaxID=38654 RepID=A0A3Q0GKS2_ALLSI|nr:uncharacterized protein LOC102376111 [Alligator sinensis]